MAEEIEIHVCILGSPSVGKSTMANQLIYNQFNHQYIPTIRDNYQYEMLIPGYQEKLNIKVEDTMGQEDHAEINDDHLINKNGHILVFAIDSQDSFDKVYSLAEELVDKIDYQIEQNPIILVGNKCDIADRIVEREEAEELVARLSLTDYMECSAKNHDQVKSVFEKLVKEIAKNQQIISPISPVNSGDNNNNKNLSPTQQPTPENSENPPVDEGTLKECTIM